MSEAMTKSEFLSTLSLRRATPSGGQTFEINLNFYPRSPCGERHGDKAIQRHKDNFYPRSPCGERLDCKHTKGKKRKTFLSTLSLRRATVPRHGTGACHRDFYPRSPCGERQEAHIQTGPRIRFLSTLSLRRATLEVLYADGPTIFLSTLSLRRATHIRSTSHGRPDISIHALLAESDFSALYYILKLFPISIHALLAESDSKSAQNSGALLRI